MSVYDALDKDCHALGCVLFTITLHDPGAGQVRRAYSSDPAAQDTAVIAFGACVTVVDEDDMEADWHIVGEDEADPAAHLIALFSPLASALLGAQVGDVVEWTKPGGTVDLEVIAIRYFKQYL